MHESSIFLHNLSEKVKVYRNIDVILAPSTFTLQSLSLQVNHRQFKLAAQNFYWRDHGAYTGEVSASQLRGLVQYGLVGHSERRHVFGERSKDIRSKVQAAVRNGITPVLCIGETASERADGETADAIHDQLIGGLANITSVEVEHIVVAYEPVWAIGTGKFAAPRDVSRAVKLIRKQIKQLFGALAAKHVRVLYGGSVNVDNASAYLQIDGVDGLLIGDTSLDVRAFAEIIKKADVIDKAVARKVA